MGSIAELQLLLLLLRCHRIPPRLRPGPLSGCPRTARGIPVTESDQFMAEQQ